MLPPLLLSIALYQASLQPDSNRVQNELVWGLAQSEYPFTGLVVFSIAK